METLKEGFLRKNLGLGKEVLIKKWLDKYNIKNYTINDDLTIDVNGSVYLTEYREEYLPDYIQFGTVIGYFDIRCSNLISLQGCPQKVGKWFLCFGCLELTSLEGCPKEVDGDFDCGLCPNLKSLKGCPKEVRGYFKCDGCGKQFTEIDVKKLSKVKGSIYVV